MEEEEEVHVMSRIPHLDDSKEQVVKEVEEEDLHPYHMTMNHHAI